MPEIQALENLVFLELTRLTRRNKDSFSEGLGIGQFKSTALSRSIVFERVTTLKETLSSLDEYNQPFHCRYISEHTGLKLNLSRLG